jgi:hypothetical protein
MNSTFYTLKNTHSFLEELNINPEINALWEIIHIIRWHKGIDWVMWLNHNKELVGEIIEHNTRLGFSPELEDKVWDSIFKIKKLDR